jgi:hypothetical protein
MSQHRVNRLFMSLAFFATFLVAFYAIPIRAEAQKTYQCGSSISQTPCVGGIERDLKDGRSQEQKKQTDKTSNSVGKTADAMEKSRLAQEKQDAAVSRGTVINAQPTPPDSPPPAAPAVLKKKKRQAPEHFTAQAPAEKKDKKKPKAKKAKDTPA